MDIVKVRVNDLKAVVENNLAVHRKVFEEAQNGYRSKVIELLDQALEDARHGGQIQQSFNLPVPQDHTEDYNRVIKMLEMTVDEVIELDESDFAQYVMDDWSWKRQFITSNAMYLSA